MTDTVQALPARIDTGTPGDGTDPNKCDAAFLNAIRADIPTKLNKIGAVLVSETDPAASVVNGQYWLKPSTYELKLRSGGAWGAAIPFGTPGEDGDDGANGTSINFNRVSVMPASPVATDIYGIVSIDAPTVITTAGGVTYTAAQLLTGNICRDCNGAGRTDTLPTAALLVAALDNPLVGQPVECRIRNWSDAAETITLAVGTGGSWDAAQVAATRVIPQFGQKVVTLRLTNVGTPAYVAYL